MADAALNGSDALILMADRLATRAAPEPALREAARLRLYDNLVATLVGGRLPDSAMLAGMSNDGHGRLRKLVATTRATEVDDIARDGCVTAGAVVVPTALHLAADMGADAAQVHDALVAGYEAMIGFAHAIGGETSVYRGLWPTLAAAPIGAAAVAARLAGFDAERTCHALALAIGRSMWWSDSTAPRWLQIGHAAVDGVRAAEAAAAGFTAAPDVLERWAIASGMALSADKLVPRTEPRLPHVDTKPFPTARQGLSAITAFMALQAAEPVTAGDSILVGVPEAYRAMIAGNARPATRLASLVSVAYQMALCAFAPERLYDAVRAEILQGPAIDRFLARVSVETDAGMDALFPAAWPAKVTILRADGRRSMSTVGTLDAENGASWSSIDIKAQRLTRANGLDPQRVAELRAAIVADALPAALLAIAG